MMDLDPSIERILKGASGHNRQNRHSPIFLPGVENLLTGGFARSESQQQISAFGPYSRESDSSDFSFAPGPRQALEDHTSLNGRDYIPTHMQRLTARLQVEALVHMYLLVRN